MLQSRKDVIKLILNSCYTFLLMFGSKNEARKRRRERASKRERKGGREETVTFISTEHPKSMDSSAVVFLILSIYFEYLQCAVNYTLHL